LKANASSHTLTESLHRQMRRSRMDGPRSDESPEPVEVFEHLPWAQLAEPSREKKPWVVLLVAGAIASAAFGGLAGRSIGRSPESSPMAVPTTVTAPIVTTWSLLEPVSERFSEADLLAETPGRSELSAAARAEWFVSDYFSTGGDPGAHQPVLAALPEGARLPAPTGPGFLSYVDWVATSRIEAIGDHRFRTTVLFRRLVSDGETGYTRLPVQAVDVVVGVDPSGGARVVDLPMPIAVPTGPATPVWAEPEEEVPSAVRNAALRLAGVWGDEPSILEAGPRQGGWRVVVDVTDEGGVHWPLALWLSDLGELVMG
jgi:hypothetical protein